VQRQRLAFDTCPTLTAASCKIILYGGDSAVRLRCQPGLFLARPETPYLPFDAARDGYPVINLAT
jgi:hypothetical protein